jgi:hypothetical protein
LAVLRAHNGVLNYQPVWVVAPKLFSFFQSFRILRIARIVNQLKYRAIAWIKPAARVYADAPDPAPREKIFEQVKAAFATPREEIFEQVKAALEQILTDSEMRERVLRMKKEGGE